MRLIACPRCHTQFDVTSVKDSKIRCHCGNEISNVAPTAVDARIQRCGSCGAGHSLESFPTEIMDEWFEEALASVPCNRL